MKTQSFHEALVAGQISPVLVKLFCKKEGCGDLYERENDRKAEKVAMWYAIFVGVLTMGVFFGLYWFFIYYIWAPIVIGMLIYLAVMIYRWRKRWAEFKLHPKCDQDYASSFMEMLKTFEKHWPGRKQGMTISLRMLDELNLRKLADMYLGHLAERAIFLSEKAAVVCKNTKMNASDSQQAIRNAYDSFAFFDKKHEVFNLFGLAQLPSFYFKNSKVSDNQADPTLSDWDPTGMFLAKK